MPNPISRPRGFSPTPYGARLCDLLAANIELHAWCGRCGRLAPADAIRLAKQHGDLVQLRDLAGRLRCHCSARNGQFYVRESDIQRIAPYR
jgi:hypothetical protein